jgi:chemotaxis methyl-accepting protein methylase
MLYRHAVPVEPAAMPAISGDIPTYTSMFRADTCIQNVLDLGLEAPQEEADSTFNVLSVGASYGAEADSALAYIAAKAPHIGRIGIHGYDINPTVVELAKQGTYVAAAPSVRGEDGKRVFFDLQKYLPAFAVTPREAPHTYDVDTNPLRRQHTVEFRRADLAENNNGVPEAQVILCNNVLFHLSPNRAERLVWGMAERLAVGGVMSFGGNSKQLAMNSNRGGTNYPQWRRRMGEQLSEQGIVPILSDKSRKAPFVFRREA